VLPSLVVFTSEETRRLFDVMNTKSKPLPENLIRESLMHDENSLTGLRWMERPRRHFATDRACSVWNACYSWRSAGSYFMHRGEPKYWQVSVGGANLLAHRVVYLLVTGSDPAEMNIDHINGDGTDNRIANLRLATPAQNGWNRGLNKNNTSGCKGVRLYKPTGRWYATIWSKGDSIHLGYFATRDEAADAYAKAAEQLHGEFARIA
jgi:hypothetical protein